MTNDSEFEARRFSYWCGHRIHKYWWKRPPPPPLPFLSLSVSLRYKFVGDWACFRCSSHVRAIKSNCPTEEIRRRSCRCILAWSYAGIIHVVCLINIHASRSRGIGAYSTTYCADIRSLWQSVFSPIHTWEEIQSLRNSTKSTGVTSSRIDHVNFTQEATYRANSSVTVPPAVSLTDTTSASLPVNTQRRKKRQRE